MVLKRLVIDVLIPHEPSEIIFAERISALERTDSVRLHVSEIDDKTKTLEITIEGEGLSFEAIRGVIEELGGSVHSIDEVVAGKNTEEPDVAGREEA